MRLQPMAACLGGRLMELTANPPWPHELAWRDLAWSPGTCFVLCSPGCQCWYNIANCLPKSSKNSPWEAHRGPVQITPTMHVWPRAAWVGLLTPEHAEPVGWQPVSWWDPGHGNLWSGVSSPLLIAARKGPGAESSLSARCFPGGQQTAGAVLLWNPGGDSTALAPGE